MLDVDTFLTALYAIVDDFHKARPKERRCPGPDASLSPSEVTTLAIFARFSRFASERDFHRYANTTLRGAFPTLPDRSQFNRLVRSHAQLIEKVALHPAGKMTAGGRGGCPPTKLWIARRWSSGTPSAEAWDGLQVTPTSDGPIGWVVPGIQTARGRESEGRHHGPWFL